MRFLLLCTLLCGTLSAQPPVQIEVHGDIEVRQHTDPLTLFSQSLQQGTETALRVRELRIQEGYLDLARQHEASAEYNRAQVAAAQERLRDETGYREFRAQTATWKINNEIGAAFSAAAQAHADFPKFLPMIEIISQSLPPKWSAITPAEYVECLYAIAKNATFAAPYRAKLLTPTIPPPGR